MNAAEFERRYALLVESERPSSLWFMKAQLDTSPEARLVVLDALQRHGSLSAYKEAGLLKRWLHGAFPTLATPSRQRGA